MEKTEITWIRDTHRLSKSRHGSKKMDGQTRRKLRRSLGLPAPAPPRRGYAPEGATNFVEVVLLNNPISKLKFK